MIVHMIGNAHIDPVWLWGSSLLEDLLHMAARQHGRGPIVFDRYDGMDRPPWRGAPPAYLGGVNSGVEEAG